MGIWCTCCIQVLHHPTTAARYLRVRWALASLPSDSVNSPCGSCKRTVRNFRGVPRRALAILPVFCGVTVAAFFTVMLSQFETTFPPDELRALVSDNSFAPICLKPSHHRHDGWRRALALACAVARRASTQDSTCSTQHAAPTINLAAWNEHISKLFCAKCTMQ